MEGIEFIAGLRKNSKLIYDIGEKQIYTKRCSQNNVSRYTCYSGGGCKGSIVINDKTKQIIRKNKAVHPHGNQESLMKKMKLINSIKADCMNNTSNLTAKDIFYNNKMKVNDDSVEINYNSLKRTLNKIKSTRLNKSPKVQNDKVQSFFEKTDVSEDAPLGQLIALVQNHPCLWDTRCSAYGDEEQQQVAWNVIASVLHPRAVQREVVPNIAARFNDLKNEFLLNPQCKYSEELSFMKHLLDTDDETIAANTELYDVQIKLEAPDEFNTNKDDSAPCEDTYHSDHHLSEENLNEDQLSSSNKEANFGSNLHHTLGEDYKIQMPVMTSSECNLQLNNVDDNALFLLSMVGDMRRVPNELQMDLRAEIMSTFSKIIKKYENMN